METLSALRSVLLQDGLERLEWSHTPEEVYVAKARLALYASLEGREYERIKLLEADPQLLKMFLGSKDYGVCTGAFRCCLNLVLISRSSGNHKTMTFIPETMGYEWIKYLIQVLCGGDMVESWDFLAEHLIPKWNILPFSWSRDFASAFLFSNAHCPGMHDLPAYQCFSQSLREWAEYKADTVSWKNHLQAFLPFLLTMLELIEPHLTWDKLTSVESWLAQLPDILEVRDAHAQVGNFLSTRKQQFVDEVLKFFTELPMAELAVVR